MLLSVLSVTLAWAMVNTVFALKYARLYYYDKPDRQGFDFGMDAEPSYSDFAYLAFTIGMAMPPVKFSPTVLIPARWCWATCCCPTSSGPA